MKSFQVQSENNKKEIRVHERGNNGQEFTYPLSQESTVHRDRTENYDIIGQLPAIRSIYSNWHQETALSFRL